MRWLAVVLVFVGCTAQSRDPYRTTPQEGQGLVPVEVSSPGWVPVGTEIQLYCNGTPVLPTIRGIGETGPRRTYMVALGHCYDVRFELRRPDQRTYDSHNFAFMGATGLLIEVGIRYHLTQWWVRDKP